MVIVMFFSGWEGGLWELDRRVFVGVVFIFRKFVVGYFEFRGVVYVVFKELMFLISVGSSYICL